MKIRFLGTGAADWPVDATDDKGYNRYFSSAVIDDILLIDPGPHIFLSADKYGIDLTKVKYIINTHPHSDHYNKESIAKLQETDAQFIEFSAGESKEIGGYNISAYQSNHATSTAYSVHFIIDDGSKKLFYGLDCAWLLYEEVADIKKKGIDLAVLDATIGDVPGDYRIFEHNNLYMVEEMKKTLDPYIKRVMISHMAYTLHTDHETLVERMKPSGIEVAFDGLETEI